jgi:nucleoside-diphosphate-sugar epimerase
MMPHAFLLGGTGQIGSATAAHLIDAGWTVTIAHRGLRPPPPELLERGAIEVTLDRDQPGALQRALGSGADALIDAVAYDETHARQLIDIQGAVGSLIVVSSSSVYRDRRGRTLDEAQETGFPELPDPISEAQPTVEPGPRTYSTRKAALERALLEEAVAPLTILRPAAVSGVGSAHAREWWFVKRMRDGRPAIPLAYGGRSRFHTSSAANIAALVHVAVGSPGQRIVNIADPEALPVSEIAGAIASACGFSGRLIALPDVDAYPPAVGCTPWSVQHPFVLDMTAATALGYRPQIGYAATVAPICDWLVQATEGEDWRALFPVLASYPYDLFDYQTEDALLGAAGL